MAQGENDKGPVKSALGRVLGWILRGLLGGLCVAAVLLWTGEIDLPNRYNPWAPLDLDAPPNILTRFKLDRLERAPEQCRELLQDSVLRHTALPNRDSADGCPLTNTVRVNRSAVAFSSPFVATCPLAAAWALFETHALQRAALRHLGQLVARVGHLGTYACRNVYHLERARRSQHATANAIDIESFTLADGSTVSVLRDWDAGGRKAAFLREIRDEACRYFHAVLGPDYNRAHANHFHLDMGRYRACR